MDEIKNFVMGYFKAAHFGCLDWCHDPDGSMYDTYFHEREAYVKMLVDMGYTYMELMNLEQKWATERARTQA